MDACGSYDWYWCCWCDDAHFCGSNGDYYQHESCDEENEINIMRLLAQQAGTLAAPFVIEAVLYGFWRNARLGNCCAWVVVCNARIIDFGEIPVFPVPWQMYLFCLLQERE